MTDTMAYLPVPLAAWEYVAAALEQAGYPGHLITHFEGKNTVAIPLDGIAIVPVGDHDIFVSSGRLADLLVQSGEDAFRAGFAAGMDYGAEYGDRAGNYHNAWSDYEVPEDILELGTKL